MNLGMGEILLLLALALVLFGAKRLPEVGRAVGSAVKEFKRGLETGEISGEEGEWRGWGARTGKIAKATPTTWRSSGARSFRSWRFSASPPSCFSPSPSHGGVPARPARGAGRDALLFPALRKAAHLHAAGLLGRYGADRPLVLVQGWLFLRPALRRSEARYLLLGGE